MVAVKNGVELHVANIGDSGFLLIRFSRDNEPYVVQKSKEQQHAFNIPYQLSILPNYSQLGDLYSQGKLKQCQKLLHILKKKNTVCQDDPSCADEYSMQLRESDIIISGTDGVFDNLFTHEILKIVAEYRALHLH